MGQQELNLRSPAYETGALPLSYDPMAPALGVEPTGWSFGGTAAAEARRQLERVLGLRAAGCNHCSGLIVMATSFLVGAKGEIRTPDARNFTPALYP